MRILLIVLLSWLVPTLALGAYMGGVMFDALREKTQAALAESAGHAQTLTVSTIARSVAIAKDVTYDGDLTRAYAAYAAGKYGYVDFYRLSRNYLERKFGRDPLFLFAAYFPANNPEAFMYTSGGYAEALEFQRNFQPEAEVLGEKLSTRCAFVGWGGQLYLVRNLYNLRLERFGMLILGVNRAELFRALDETGSRWGAPFDIRLGGYDGAAVDWENEPDGISERGENLSFTQRHAEWDFTLFTRLQVPKNAVYAEMAQAQKLLIFLVLAIVPLGIAVLWFVHRRIAKPILILSRASRRMAEGELGVTVPMRGPDELGQLGVAFSSMSEQIRHLVDTVLKGQLSLKDARIEALQRRINPHFLNNALELITWQARMDGSEAVAAMVEALSVLLNASLDRGEHPLVPLSEEMDVADAYFYFIRLRFGERLVIWKDADPALMGVPLPRMIVQTLLENAVEHGIAPSGGGHIRLNVFKNEAGLNIEVLNSGKRLTPVDRDRIERLLREEGAGEGHVGIRNVSARLRLIYGGRASFSIREDDRTHDTVASIIIPLEAGG